jgi:hypothetical protein
MQFKMRARNGRWACNLIVTIAWFAVIGVSGRALSAEIKCQSSWGGAPPNNRCYEARLTGEIVIGDAERMGAFLKRERQLSQLKLVSSGGNLLEAIKIARMVRDSLLETTTELYDPKHPSESACDGACAIVALGGVSRRLGNIGLHRPYSQGATDISFEQVVGDYEIVIKELESFFTEMSLPRSLLDRMLTVGPEAIDRISSPREAIRKIIPDFYAPFQEWLHPRCKKAEKYYDCMLRERQKEIFQRASGDLPPPH